MCGRLSGRLSGCERFLLRETGGRLALSKRVSTCSCGSVVMSNTTLRVDCVEVPLLGGNFFWFYANNIVNIATRDDDPHLEHILRLLSEESATIGLSAITYLLLCSESLELVIEG